MAKAAKYCVLDIETTDVNPAKSNITYAHTAYFDAAGVLQGEHGYWVNRPQDEPAAINSLLDTMAEYGAYVLVGFNVLKFDWGYLCYKAGKYGIYPPFSLFIDDVRIMQFGTQSKGKLADACTLHGIKHDDTFTGKDAAEAGQRIQAGKERADDNEKIAEHCIDDVHATAEVWAKLKGVKLKW